MPITWAAVRAAGREAAPAAQQPDMVAGWTAPPLRGVGTLLFAVGRAATRVLRQLTVSAWFAELRPRPEDLPDGGRSAGRWTACAGGDRADAQLAALPTAVVATVAVGCGAGPDERVAALALVAALRRQRDLHGGRLHVVVTLQGASLLVGGFAANLVALGACVLRSGMGADGVGFHTFPLRAPLVPQAGRLVCADLADFLHSWRPGRIGVLHTLAADPAVVGSVLARTAPMSRRVTASNLLLVPDPREGQPLELFDQLSALCRTAFGPDADHVGCDGDRPDGRIGLVDLAVFHT